MRLVKLIVDLRGSTKFSTSPPGPAVALVGTGKLICFLIVVAIILAKNNMCLTKKRERDPGPTGFSYL